MGKLSHFLLLLLLSTVAIAEDQPEGNDSNSAAAEEQTSEQQTPDAEQAEGDDATPARVELPRVNPQPVAHRHAAVIEHLSLHQRQREVVQMVADNIAFNGLFLQETAGTPQGGILLLHDNEQHGHWPTITAPLREYLPNYGWATLAIELPSQPQQILPARGIYEVVASEEDEDQADENGIEQAPDTTGEEATTAESADSTGIAASGNPEPSQQQPEQQPDENFDPNAEPALPRLTGLPEIPAGSQTSSEQATEQAASLEQRYQQQMIARIETAMNYLRQRGQFNLVIIANGDSASWAVDYMLNRQTQLQAENKDVIGNTLVLIDPLQNRYNQLYLDNQLQQLEIPVLDLITDHNLTPTSDIKRRAGMMKHKQRQSYRQILISAPDLHSANHHALKRRIRGWLKTNAAGTELPTL